MKGNKKVQFVYVTGKIVLFFTLVALCAACFFDSAYYNGSEGLVNSRIVAAQNDMGLQRKGYGLGSFVVNGETYLPGETLPAVDIDTLRESQYVAYTSQIGLQGEIIGRCAELFPQWDYTQYQKLYAVALSLVLCLISWQLSKKYDILYALSFLGVSLISPWIVKFAKNLYWAEFLWFLPLLLSLLCLNYWRYRFAIYPFFAVAIYLKCLCGFEYISTIMMGGISLLIVEWICAPSTRKKWGCSILWIGAFSLIGFAAAFAQQALLAADGDFFAGFQAMIELALKRTAGSGDGYSDIVKASLQTPWLLVVKKYLLDGIEGKAMLCILLVTVTAIIYRAKVQKKDVRFETALCAVFFLGALSWIILGKGHSYIHTHLNFVLWYLGWVQACGYICLRVLVDMPAWALRSKPCQIQEENLG